MTQEWIDFKENAPELNEVCWFKGGDKRYRGYTAKVIHPLYGEDIFLFSFPEKGNCLYVEGDKTAYALNEQTGKTITHWKSILKKVRND